MTSEAFADFPSLPLHDAILSEMRIDWAARTCVASVCASVVRGGNAHRHQITWRDVKSIMIPHEAPWGQSIFINEVRQQADSYTIEMQSGDVIRIVAGSFDFS